MPHSYAIELPDANYFARQVLCREGCPVRTDAGGYVQAIADGRYEDAYLIARAGNPFASICGRVCAAPCEAKCRRGALDAAVSIRALKRFVCEKFGVESDAFDLGRVYPESLLQNPRADGRKGLRPSKNLRNSVVFDLEGGNPLPPQGVLQEAPELKDGAPMGRGQKAAVVGAGPAGLACAHELALLGFEATVFEAQSVAGGMLVLGVPEYRLPRELIKAEIQAIESLGVKIRLDQKLGRDFSLADLAAQGFEAVFLGIGAHLSRDLAIEGVQLDGVLRAIDFLLNINLGYRVTLGRKVVVIGGGNVAFDVARSMLRQAERFAEMTEAELRAALHAAAGALEALTAREPEAPDEVRLALDVAREAIRKGVPEVHMYCLENLDEIPAAREEIEEAEREGIRLHTRFGPKRILGGDGKVQGIELIKCGRVFDENRRFNPRFVEGSEETVACDTVVLAIGQAADLSWLRPEDGLKLTPRGALQTEPQTLATSRPGVFAGGDVAFGPRIIVTAVAEGQRAARSIARFLAGGDVEPLHRVRVRVYDTGQYRMTPDYEKLARCSPPTLPLDRRIGIAEVEQIYSEPAALAQAGRCLKCHVSPVFDGDRCILCGGCADVCPENCLRLVDIVDLRGDERLQAAFLARYGRIPPRGEQAAIVKDETLCIRCGLCAARCPAGAVTMEQVEFMPS